jgi:PAS domain S-box-containing protein
MKSWHDKTKSQLIEKLEVLQKRVEELERFQTELAEEELKASEENYRMIFDSINDAIMIHNVQTGRPLDTNQKMVELLGYGKEELTQIKVGDWTAGDPTIMQEKALQRINEAALGKPQLFEWHVKRKDSKLIWVEVNLKGAVIRGQKCVLAVVRDITERKQAEKEIERVSRFPNENPDPVLRVNIEGTVYYANTASDVLLKKWKTSVRGKLPASLMQSMANIVAVSGDYKFEETCDEKVFEVRCVPIEDYGYINLYASDITERQQAEEALRESEKKYRLLFESIPDAITTIDEQGTIISANNSVKRILGYEPSELLGKPVEVLAPEELKSEQKKNIIKAINKGFLESQDTIRVAKDGTLIPIGISVFASKDSTGNLLGISAIMRDITERKRAEEALKQSEFFLREAQRIAYLGSYEFDFHSGYWTSSDILDDIFGIDKSYVRIFELWTQLIHPDDKEEMVNYFTNDVVAKHEKFNKEYRIINLHSKEERWVHGLGELEFDEDGAPIKMIGTIQDITMRKQTEQALVESEERFSRFSDAAFEGIVISDKGKVLDANNQLAGMLGYQISEIIGKKAIDFVAPSSYDLVSNMIMSGYEGLYEHLALRKDGSIFPVEVQSKTLPYGGKAVRVSAIRDITERKLTEKALRDSEEKFRTMFNESPIGIELYKEDGMLLSVNKASLNMFGIRDVSEVQEFNIFDGISLDVEKKEKLRKGESVVYQSTFNFEKVKELQQYKTDRIGKAYFDYIITPLLDTKRETIQGYLLQVQDITESKYAERKLRESRNRLRSLAERLQMIREEERGTVAREIHDDLGQSLTALKMDISWMMKNPEMEIETRAGKLNMMLDLTDSTIQTVKRIATELRPGILDDLGLIPAIEWQAGEFQNRFKVRCNQTFNKTDIIVRDEISIAVFRIFQETLTNVARHSRATKVDTNLNIQDNDLLVMEISDNGVGIEKEKSESPKSLGLIGMRERVSILKGDLEIIGKKGVGTTVRISIPI